MIETIDRPEIQVGVRVIFVGPEYRFTNGPTIGERGVVTERAGYTCQPVGEPISELVTVKFDMDKKATVLDLSKIKLDS